ncbi:SusC/RagA family TonB-linked outer membrane protein [Membranihabitans maritimus]|uniref:SusC/RagA family TonB-linked outer membrane protein n=1 Tax=Membranihabitans maritimus TaxID=2904244 RepID=UPI001F490078|nr:TonB-dependent receptor [Membranihabitans maritimus]
MNSSVYTKWMGCLAIIIALCSPDFLKAEAQLEERLLIEVLEEISEHYKIVINYDTELLKNVKVRVEKAEMVNANKAIEAVLSQTDLKYEYLGTRYYVIYSQKLTEAKTIRKLKRKLKQIRQIEEKGKVKVKINPSQTTEKLSEINRALAVYLQGITVSGTVTDDEGEPLIGVNVLVKGGNNGTSTDFDGNFELLNVEEDATLVFSYVGYQTQEVAVEGRESIQVELLSDAQLLDELVVVGYGTVRKSDLTGSVGTVEMKDLEKAPVGSFAEALAGRVSGVRVISSDGQPGGGIDIMIRGVGSLTQSTAPLFVVDGFPIEGLDPATLNPEDIESISVLKDASSTAIYGSRAANGVVLIQTKRGSVGKPVVTLSSSVGFQGKPEKMELMSPYEFLKYQMELNPNHSSTLSYFENGETLDDYRNVEPIDWQDKVFQNGAVQIHDLSIRGGNDETKYSISGSMYDQNGVIINTGYNRYSGRFTLNQKVGRSIDIGVSADYAGTNKSGQVISTGAGSSSPSAYVLMRTWVYRPVLPSGEDPDEFFSSIVDDDAVTTSDFRVNPFIDLDNQHQKDGNNILNANISANIKILDGLTFKSVAGFRERRRELERFYNSNTSQGSDRNPYNINGVNGSVSNLNYQYLSNENTLNYEKNIGEHQIKGLALFGINQYKFAENGYGGRLLPNEELGIDGLDQGLAYNPGSSSSLNTMVSYAGRLDYTYMSKYLLTLTYRADASSKFMDPWGYFPSAAIGWNLDQEEIFNELFPFLSKAKIRTSYGSTGNNRVGDFSRFPSLSQSLNGYSFNNATPTQMVYVSSVGNSTLRWEKVNTVDFGLELGAFRNRVLLELDVYRRSTEDMLLNTQLPPTTGFSSAFKNIGKLKNEGLEITLNTINFERKNFGWTSSFNISFNKNTILELTENQQALYTNGRYESQFNKPLYMAEIGKPAGTMIGFVWEGNYQFEDFENPSDGVYILKDEIPSNGAIRNTIRPGDIKYKDLNGDGTIDNNDLTIIGRGQPLHVGGLSNNFHYKGLSLNLFFQWAYGNNIFNANRLALEGNSNGRNLVNQFASYVNRWTPENPTNENYRTRGQGPIGFYSSKTVEDGSYLRLKTLSLDYALPQSVIGRTPLSGLTFSIAAQNLLTWTKYTGLDPEVSILNPVLAPSYDFSGYPQVKTVTFGLKAVF